MERQAFAQKLSGILTRLRHSFRSDRTRPLAWREEQLRALRALLVDNEPAICEALWADLRKSPFEAQLSEYGFVIGEIDHTLAHLDSWIRPDRAPVRLLYQPARAQVVHEPLGLVLIIGAWNYPIHLLLAPLVGALAGGNVALIKPSEVSAATASLLADLVPRYLDANAVCLVEGGPNEMELILGQPFDHIFFTGSTAIGRIVLEKAARHLTPVTLELGGKCPCLVDRDADPEVAARRIAWGKFMNAGQTCIAPDYVLVHEAASERLLAELRNAIVEFYGDDPRHSPDFCRIINRAHHDRLVKLLAGCKVYCGGEIDAEDRYIAPTIVRNPSGDAAIMQEEIFGPILPVLAVPDMEAAVRFVNERAKPLALYLFSENHAVQDLVLAHTTSGGVSINDVVLQVMVPALPFGGIGSSGMGHYHGRWSFETFTHAKGIFRKSTRFDPALRYPPYTESQRRWLRWLA